MMLASIHVSLAKQFIFNSPINQNLKFSQQKISHLPQIAAKTRDFFKFCVYKRKKYDIIKPSNVTTMLCSVVTLEVGFIDIIAYGTDNFVVFMI